MLEGNTATHEVTPSPMSFYLCKRKVSYFKSVSNSHKNVSIVLQDEGQQV